MSTSLLHGWITPDALATYSIGIAAILGGTYQLRRSFRLNKQSAVFEDLSKLLRTAESDVNNINTLTTSLIDLLVQAANAANWNTDNRSQTDIEAEINRRAEQLKLIVDKQIEHTSKIYDSYKSILDILQTIERSTLISKRSKESARYLFYAANDQYQLVETANKVVISFNVTPPVGANPNVTSATFNAFSELLGHINEGNTVVGNYLSNLEVILHNDLVSKIYKKATVADLPARYLTLKGFKDKRVKKPLV